VTILLTCKSLRDFEFEPAHEEGELRHYPGNSYDRGLHENYQRTLNDEFATCGDNRAFYRTSEAYLYNDSVFAMSRTTLPYLEELTAGFRPALGYSTTAALSAPTDSSC
jgi:hypothetical protein